MSGNDCYATEGEKYELVGLYDIDELILPRNIEDNHDENKIALSCANNKMCSESFIPYSLYDYLIKLIQNEKRIGGNMSKMSTMFFKSALYLPVNENTRRLMREVKIISTSNNISFPINVYLSHGEKEMQPFEIDKNDFEHVKNLVEEYESFECLHEKYKDELLNAYPNFTRFLYLIHEVKPGIQSPYKAIHYTNNVRAFYTHGPIDVINNGVIFFTNMKNVHLLSHFRYDPSGYLRNNINASITRLKVDKGYLNYLIRNLTKFCK